MTTQPRFENLVELLDASCSSYGSNPLFGTRRGGQWSFVSYAEFRALVDRFRGGLATLGIGEGDRVAIIADNRLEWAVACFATYGLRAAFVPMYRAVLPRDWTFILGDCGAKAVIAGDREVAASVDEMRPELPALEHLIALEGGPGATTSYDELLRAGEVRPAAARPPASDTIASFIYTSGTTGNPKGVLLTHGNFTSNVNAVAQIFPLESSDRSLAFLPWAHAYGQTVELYILMSNGASTAINDDVAHLARNLSEVKPTVLVAVPRIFNKIYDSVHAQVAGKPALVQRLFRDGLEAAQARAAGRQPGSLQRLELALADRLIFSKVRARFGGRMRFVVSAAAALSPDVARFIDAVGITVYEGYGLTETSPVVACNYPNARRLGSVGRVIPGVRVDIDEARSPAPGMGEIVVHGPNVMVGYHNRPEENEATFTPEGGLRTGDLGYIDDDGFLYVTGRIKEQYKLENGKYVMPAPVEETLRLSPYISNAMLSGANRPYNVALLALDLDAIKGWAEREGVELDDPRTDERVQRLIAREIETHAQHLRSYEVPRRWAFFTEDPTTENGMLTPTLKLKRRNVMALYGGVLDSLYEQPGPERPVAAEAPAPEART